MSDRAQCLSLVFWPNAVILPPEVPWVVRQRLMRKTDPASNVPANTKSAPDDEVPSRFFLEIATDDRKCLAVICNPPLPDCTRYTSTGNQSERGPQCRQPNGVHTNSRHVTSYAFCICLFFVLILSRFVSLWSWGSSIAPITRQSRFAISARPSRCIIALCYPTCATIVSFSSLHGCSRL
jgi:hypothetical protein